MSITSNEHGKNIRIAIVDDDSRGAALHGHLNLPLERALATAHERNELVRQIRVYVPGASERVLHWTISTRTAAATTAGSVVSATTTTRRRVIF